jgi:hypothetical protein
MYMSYPELFNSIYNYLIYTFDYNYDISVSVIFSHFSHCHSKRKGKRKAKEAINGAEDAWSNPLS